jgi:hypothetical protein
LPFKHTFWLSFKICFIDSFNNWSWSQISWSATSTPSELGINHLQKYLFGWFLYLAS